MSNKIQIKRGIKTNLPVLDVGEPAFTTDTQEFFIGDGSSNIQIAKQSDLEITNMQLSDMDYQTAVGTATALTLTMQTLRNGYAKNFIASASNAGATTTINGKQLYKPGTTTAPNLIAGKAYTVWYNAPGNCFFIKASAEGDVLASQVLATKKFSNNDDTGLVGTMPNNGALGITLGINGTYAIPSGYTTGGTVTQNITTKAATTINPSTVAQTIAAGQYLSGVQTIAAVGGTANPADVVSGKIFSSASGINQTGTATVGSLGGKKFATGPAVYSSGDSTLFTTVASGTSNSEYVTASGLTFTPSTVIMYSPGNGNASPATGYYSSTLSGGYYVLTSLGKMNIYLDTNYSWTEKYIVNGASSNIYYGGFKLPVCNFMYNWTYIAIE